MNWLSKSVTALLVALVLNLPLAHAATISCSGEVVVSAACSCCGGESNCCVAAKVFPEERATQALISGPTVIHPLGEDFDLISPTFLRKSHCSIQQVKLVRGPPIFLKFVRILI